MSVLEREREKWGGAALMPYSKLDSLATIYIRIATVSIRYYNV